MAGFRLTSCVADVLEQFVVATEAEGPGAELYGAQIGKHAKLKTGTVYPILDRLLEAGMLADRREEEPVKKRPRRRYFRLADDSLAAARDLLAAADRRASKDAALVMEGVPDVSSEDCGAALILEIASNQRGVEEFVRLHSWYLDNSHPVLGPLKERRLRVTVEVLDGASAGATPAWQARYDHLMATHGCRCESPNDGLLGAGCSRHAAEAKLVTKLALLVLDLRSRAEGANSATETFALNSAAESLARLLDNPAL